MSAEHGSRRPPPLHHGVIGNGRVLALVAPTGAVEWACLPQFDSPSVFARLLDGDSGGSWRVLAADAELRGAGLLGEMRYLPNTNVLCTTFTAGELSWEVIDFAPDRKSTRLNSSHLGISYAVFCLKKKTKKQIQREQR